MICIQTIPVVVEVLHKSNIKNPVSSNFIKMGDSSVSGIDLIQERAKLLVIGHRGMGKNKIALTGEAPDPRPSIRENTILSFNTAANNGADLVEFDVQVTKDGYAVIFHDDLIITDDQIARPIRELTLEEFMAIGLQKDPEKTTKALLRKGADGSFNPWGVTMDDHLCTLKDAFELVQETVGFNIELKFPDDGHVIEEELHRVISIVVKEVKEHAKGRKIFFSSFHPDAVHKLRQMQASYAVFFLTDGGVHTFNDSRRNSIEAAIEVCKKSSLQGIVSEVKAILHSQASVMKVKEAGLTLLTYGELNNVTEALYKQQELGGDGVIVDHVLEMVTVARGLGITDDSSSAIAGNMGVKVLA